jgi:hypothetical protein
MDGSDGLEAGPAERTPGVTDATLPFTDSTLAVTRSTVPRQSPLPTSAGLPAMIFHGPLEGTGMGDGLQQRSGSDDTKEALA